LCLKQNEERVKNDGNSHTYPLLQASSHYCDFHFDSMKKRNICFAFSQEILLAQGESVDEKVETIYFGGGTPSPDFSRN
jgi:coproporphyrinogen III oxidase-like Fe-S oxidoreductase